MAKKDNCPTCEDKEKQEKRIQKLKEEKAKRWKAYMEVERELEDIEPKKARTRGDPVVEFC